MQRCLVLGWLMVLACAGVAAADDNYNAQWIWADGGDPANNAPAESVWFRYEVRAGGPSTGMARVVADDGFVLWANGQRIGQGEGGKLYRFSLNGIVERGVNVIAVEATNRGGRAGLFVDGEVRDQGGGSIPFDSGAAWKATRTAPQGDAWLQAGFDASGWQPVKVIGAHADSPWRDIALKETYLDRFEPARGFDLVRIAEPQMTGSLIALTGGNRGRLIVARERGPILSLIDDNHDGTFDRAVEYSTEVKNCQGLGMVFDTLYAIGDGPDGVGLYQLPDLNHDDVADRVIHLYKFKGGMGDHGPHDVVFGPDGWLYCNLGNHSWVTAEPEPNTPVRNYYEGHPLEPRFEDANGHAAGIKAPGGTIWRLSADGKRWWCQTSGFRNEYDFAFNAQGDMFTFDSDMEWDVGMPWYRPVRVNHCILGAEFGWRSGSTKWPDYRFDSLPGTVDVGRGSPTGVVFYEHHQFPEKYRGAFLVCDWSMGRLMMVRLQPKGASYTGEFDVILNGNPLNVSDVEVDRDGSVVFCTGGRNTEGGVYRLSYAAGSKTPVTAADVDDVLHLPQIQSAWAREIAERVRQQFPGCWQRDLYVKSMLGTAEEKVRALTLSTQFGPKPSVDLLVHLTRDADAGVRAFAVYLLGEHQGAKVQRTLSAALDDADPVVRRRACEAFVRSGLEPPVERLLRAMESDDRWLRFAARIALERVPAQKWVGSVLDVNHPHLLTQGLLALYRLKESPVAHADALKWEAAALRDADKLRYTPEQKLAVLRMVELTLLSGGRDPVAGDIAEHLVNRFPTGDEAFDMESARILAQLQSHKATGKIMNAMEASPSRARQIDYVLTLRFLKVGWNFDMKTRLVDWFEKTRDWEGGNSFTPYLANIVGATLEYYQPNELQALLADWKKRPHAAGLMIERSTPDRVAGFDQIVASILSADTSGIDPGRRERLVSAAIEALGRGSSDKDQQLLRTLYESEPDRRELLARQLAKFPAPENAPFLIRSLQYNDATTMQLCIQALAKLATKPNKPDEIRAVILAGLRLEDKGGANAVKLLAEMTGAPHDAKDDVKAGVAFYQKWYQEHFPDAVPGNLPKDDADQSKYSYQQLVDYLEKDPHGQHGDTTRGRAIFTKGKCVKCHRFGNEGETIGPDLTTIRRRFQQKEIIESMIYPSQVISDQYRMVTVVTKEGLVHNGMPVPANDKPDKLVLLLSDTTKIEIPKGAIEEQSKSKVSVMPVGALKDLTLEEIADLIAYLETSKTNTDTSTAARGQAPPAGGQ